MHEVREAVATDAPALLEHLAAVFSEGLPTLFSRAEIPSLEVVRQNLEACAASPNSVVFVASARGEVVGTLDFHGYARPQQRHAGRFGMSVRRERRGGGIGTALIEALVAWAPPNGVSRLELEVFSNNPRAIRLYERLGFRREGRRLGAVLVAGRPVDILQLARQRAADGGS